MRGFREAASVVAMEVSIRIDPRAGSRLAAHQHRRATAARGLRWALLASLATCGFLVATVVIPTDRRPMSPGSFLSPLPTTTAPASLSQQRNDSAERSIAGNASSAGDIAIEAATSTRPSRTTGAEGSRP